MHVHFLVNYDQYQAGDSAYVEPSLGRGLCNNKMAIPHSTHLKAVAEKKAKASAEKEAKAKAKARLKAIADADKKAKELKAKVEDEKETMISKKSTKRSKAVKP